MEHQALWPRVFVTLGGRVENNANFGTAAVPRGAVAVVVHRATAAGGLGATTVHANAGLGIKEPTLTQSFGLSIFARGNPDLAPERSRTVEVGAEQRLAADRVKLSVTGFDNQYRNLITTLTTNPATFAAQYFNVGRTRARGVEAAAEVAPHAFVRGRIGYTYLDSVVLEGSPASTVLTARQSLFRRPKHSGYAGITWHDTRLTVDLDGIYIGRYVDNDFVFATPLLTGGGYSTWDARFSYQLMPRLAVTAAIDNLADAHYMQPLGYPALDRAWRAGLKVGL